MADDHIAVDAEFEDSDSAYSPEEGDWQLRGDTASIDSSIYRGLIENGRRYQSLRKHEYPLPSDELQFETYEAGHMVDLILNHHKSNPLFQSPIGHDRDANIRVLDIGTGKGTWALDVADMFPNGTVRGVDLYPPPVDWTPPNCILEIDDILQEWTWREQFDLIYMRNMLGSFNAAEWSKVYKQCYEKLQPGGWIEQLEVGPFIESDDGTLPADSALASWGQLITGCGERSGRSCDVIFTMASCIRDAGFVDVHEKVYKWPIGPWPKDPRIKEAGLINYKHWMTGLEGWAMYLLTRFGTPKPWTKEAVYVFCAKMRSEIKNTNYHAYHKARRVWARKPHLGEVPEDSNRSRSPTAMSQDISQLRAKSDSGSPKSKSGELPRQKDKPSSESPKPDDP